MVWVYAQDNFLAGAHRYVREMKINATSTTLKTKSKEMSRNSKEVEERERERESRQMHA